MAGIKITDYNNEALSILDDDLFDISKIISSGPNVYESQKVKWSTIASMIPTLYSADGVLSGDRIIDFDGHTLTFENGAGIYVKDNAGFIQFNAADGTPKGKIGITGSSLILNGDNFFVKDLAGVAALQVTGLTTTLYGMVLVDGTEGAGKVLTSDALGGASWQDATGGGGGTNIYNSNGALTGDRYVGCDLNDITFGDAGTIGLLGQNINIIASNLLNFGGDANMDGDVTFAADTIYSALTANTFPYLNGSKILSNSFLSQDSNGVLIANGKLISSVDGSSYIDLGSGSFMTFISPQVDFASPQINLVGAVGLGDDASSEISVNGFAKFIQLTASQRLELNASKEVISVAKGTADNKNFGAASGTVTEGNDWRLNLIAVIDGGSFAVSSPADATTLYAGVATPLAPNANPALRQFKLPNGIIRMADLYVDPTSTIGSGEAVTVNLRNITDGTSTLIGTLTYDSRGNTNFVTGLNIATSTSKVYAFEYVYPTWVTNPTNVYTLNHLYIYSN
jgi:hypothetical protein